MHCSSNTEKLGLPLSSVSQIMLGVVFFLYIYIKSVSLGGEKIISFYHQPETRLQGGLDFYEPFFCFVF